MSRQFDLGLVRGRDFTIKGYYATIEALEEAVTDPEPGDAYGVGSEAPYTIYVYDSVGETWLNNGTMKGDTGEAATVSVGTVTTGAAGTDASVSNSGDEYNAVFNFTIPRGAKGNQGNPGTNGVSPTLSSTKSGGTTTIYYTDATHTSGTDVLATVNDGQTQDISGKADKVSGATNGDIPVLNGSGNLADSGYKPDDYVLRDDSYAESANGTTAKFYRSTGGIPVEKLTADIEYSQAGSGTPSTTNVRTISGWTGATVYQSGADTSDPSTTSISWGSVAGTVCRGTLNVTTGLLTVTHVLWEKNTSTMDNSENYPGWKNAGVRALVGANVNQAFYNVTMNIGTTYSINTTSTNDVLYLQKALYGNLTQTEWIALAVNVQAIIELATPATYQLAPTQVLSLLGENNIWANTGDVAVDFGEDVKAYLDSMQDTVTPEMFGARGDGTSDDTKAWQQAVDTGKRVYASSKQYKCGRIKVTADADIDCNNATFTCTGNLLFDCAGTAEDGTSESDYTANGTYQLSDTFTGLVWLVGTNNVFKERPAYVGGSIEYFYEGELGTQIPVDITTVTAYRLNPIQVNIRNIADVQFADTSGAKVVKMTYCAFSVVENVNMTHLCYSVVSFNQCFKCTYRDSHFDIPQYGTLGDTYYPIAILDTCYTTIERIQGHNVGWHCITTGSNTLCRGTHVRDCEFYCDNYVSAYCDHENGIETLIEDSTISGVRVGALGRVHNCDIVCMKRNNACSVEVNRCSVEGLAAYTVSNCRFWPISSPALISIRCDPYDTQLAYDYYFDSLYVENCQNMSSTATMEIRDRTSSNITGATPTGDIYLINTPWTVSFTATHIYETPLLVDSTPTNGSTNLITSGGVYTAILGAIGGSY